MCLKSPVSKPGGMGLFGIASSVSLFRAEEHFLAESHLHGHAKHSYYCLIQLHVVRQNAYPPLRYTDLITRCPHQQRRASAREHSVRPAPPSGPFRRRRPRSGRPTDQTSHYSHKQLSSHWFSYHLCALYAVACRWDRLI